MLSSVRHDCELCGSLPTHQLFLMGQVASIWTAQQEHIPKVLRRHRMELLLRNGVTESMPVLRPSSRPAGRNASPSCVFCAAR